MTEDDMRIFQLLAARIRERFPEARIWVFGSRARGDATWDSDFDTCGVLDHLDAAADEALSDIAWEVGFEHGRVITVLPFSGEDFERGPSRRAAWSRRFGGRGSPHDDAQSRRACPLSDRTGRRGT